MSPFGYAWRTAVLVLAVLSAVVAVGGFALTQFDSQYDADSVIERLLAGVVAGLFGAFLFLPATIAIAGLIGLGAGGSVALRDRGCA